MLIAPLLELENVFPAMQLLARLGQYEELGPEFNTLAEKYQQILEDLRHAEFTLEELKQAAAAEAGAESP